jgi:hypothetical protein
MIWKCDREPARDDGTPPSAPPSDRYLDAWMAARGVVKRRDDEELPADVAAFVGGL